LLELVYDEHAESLAIHERPSLLIKHPVKYPAQVPAFTDPAARAPVVPVNVAVEQVFYTQEPEFQRQVTDPPTSQLSELYLAVHVDGNAIHPETDPPDGLAETHPLIPLTPLHYAVVVNVLSSVVQSLSIH